MENKPNHEQEPRELIPEELSFDTPEYPAEELVIEELSFGEPTEEAPAEEVPVEALVMEELSMESPAQEPEAPMPEEPAVEETLPILPEKPVREIAPDFPPEEAAYVIGTTPVEEEPAFVIGEPPVREQPALEEILSPQEPAPEESTSDQLPEAPAALPPQAEPEAPQPEPEKKPAAKTKKAAQDASRATLKGRPKRKKGEGLLGIPNILTTFVWLALIVVIGVTLGRMLWVCAADVLAFGREDKQVTITVYEADTMDEVIDKLYEAGLIRYKSLFRMYADISNAEEDIRPGIYDLNTRYDYHALVNFMSPSSTREVVEITIPEGYTCRQIFALLEENRVCTAVDIGAYAANGELSDYWFLEGLERGSEYCLEGYLFPDTYQFYKNSTPREALEKMLNNFENRFTEDMMAQIGVLNADVTDGTYGIREIIIVASLIEKESAAPSESPVIASVIYNRLFNWEYPALLNIDAAIVYAQGGDAEVIDTGIDSPYNTYRYTGLTPTAISNPGLSSIMAALNPENTDYYFYVLNPATGMHQFSTTQAEHDAWIDKFYG